MLPQAVGGKIWMFFMADARGERIKRASHNPPNLVTWHEALDHPVLSRREGRFEFAGGGSFGPPPVLTDEGVLLFYVPPMTT